MTRTASLLSVAALWVLAHPALAQDAEPVVAGGDGSADVGTPASPATQTAAGDDADASLERYAPDYFAQFQPNTALDMVRQVPGFTLRGGGGGDRGFGEANTNFLINGRRPSTKSQSAGDLLSRIPAASVIRIEILDGASLDIPGLSGQVVNVVARAVELSGNWRYAARFEEGTRPQILEGEVSLSGKTGALGFAIGVENRQFTRTEDSVEQFFTDDPSRGGLLFEDRREQPFLGRSTPVATANLSWTPESGSLAGHVANLNGRIQRPNNNDGVFEQFTALDDGGLSGQSEVYSGEDELEYEISGDYALPVGAGQFKAIGLYRYEDSDIRTVFINALDAQSDSRTVFGRDEQEREIIARGEYAWTWGESHDLQLSAEYAFNSLDSTQTFESTDVPLTRDDVLVEEDRFDARLSDSWSVNDRLALQASIGAEYSELGVVAPDEAPRGFFRPKGSLAASFKQSDRWAWRARVERGVGQLNFGTFVSTRNLVDNILNSGNEEIKPDQFWSANIELERTDAQALSFRISPYYRFIEDPIDRVLFPDGTEGPGNLDSAERFGIEGDATLVMDGFGVPGLRFDVSAQIQDSGIDDPLTGERRPLNRVVEWQYDLEARYDIPGTEIALLGEVEGFQGTPFVRFDEFQRTTEPEPEVELAVVFKNLFGVQLEVGVQNLLDAPIIRRRERYLGPDRRLGPITRFERFERLRGRRLSITVSDTF